MDRDKERQEISVMGRLLSLEALVLLMGAVSLGYGLAVGQPWKALLGGAILLVAVALFKRWRAKR